jgi:phage terminase large subunit GpA-like protein
VQNLAEIIEDGRAIWQPRQRIAISEWAAQNRYVSREESGRAGQWDNDLVLYLVEPMDAFVDPTVEHITFMGSAQVAKTEMLKNIIGYIIDHDPSPVLVVYSADDDAREFSTEKLQPMIDYNACLYNKLTKHTITSKENKTLYKKFLGGFLAIAGGRVPQKLARRSIKYVIVDDRDRVGTAGNEGDAVSLAFERTESYALLGRKTLEFSTPTIEGASGIKASYLLSDQRQYYVTCMYCGTQQTLKFGNPDTPYGLKWKKDKDAFGNTIKHYPETTKYMCEGCGELIEERYKYMLLKSGVWIPKHPDIIARRGYWINRLYSPFSTWAMITNQFLLTYSDPTKHQVFLNTYLAETYRQEVAEEMDERGLIERVEDYRTKENPFVPAQVLLLTFGVDVQPDRLELQVLGFGLGKEVWVIDYQIFTGDTSHDEMWNELDHFVENVNYKREDGYMLRIAYVPRLHHPVFVDSGDNATEVYKQCKKRYTKGWLAIKGKGGHDVPMLHHRSRVGKKKDTLMQNLGVDAIKNLLFRLLELNKSPNKVHFSKAICDLDYFRQLTNEKGIIKQDRKRGKIIEWVKKKPGVRVEKLDTFNYAYAAMISMNANFDRIEKRQQEELIAKKGELPFTGATNKEETEKRKVVRRRVI